MTTRPIFLIALMGALVVLVVALSGCEPQPAQDSASNVKQATAAVKTNAAGLTVEQENVKRRLEEDNKPGEIKHLYVISAFSGDVLIYSTVKGKVTSSGKRLTPTRVTATYGPADSTHNGYGVRIRGKVYATPEVMQDDGTYGSSIPYVFWFDAQDIYRQHYVSGGQILHVSSQPLNVPKVVINMEETQ